MKYRKIISGLLAFSIFSQLLPLSLVEQTASAEDITITRKSILNGSTYTINPKFEGYEILDGIDVSKWQGDINWDGLESEGIDFAIIRLGYRSTSSSGAMYIDNYFEQNIAGANDAGIDAGVYFYSQATTPAEAIAEAKYCISNLEGYELQLPIVMDFEYAWVNGGHGGRLYDADLSEDEATEVIFAFLDTVKAAGYEGMLYANKYTLYDSMHAEELEEEYPVWLAHYNTQTDYEGDYLIWQYSDAGQLDSIDGYVDCNFMFLPQELEDIYFAQEEYIIEQGQKFTMPVEKVPESCIAELTWQTSNPAVAYFTKDTSTLVAVAPGTTDITVKSANGLEAKCKVTVRDTLSDVTISGLSSLSYTGSALTPSFTVYDKGYSDEKLTDSATLFAKPSKYSTKLMTLNAGSDISVISETTVDGVAFYSAYYDDGINRHYGYIEKAKLECTANQIKLYEGLDYTTAYTNNTASGTATVTVTATGSRYLGKKEQSFSILPLDINNAVVVDIPTQQYTGSSIVPAITVSYNGKALKLGTDYTLAYSNNTAVGTATVKVTGKGGYTGTATKTFKISSGTLTNLSAFTISVSTGTLSDTGELIAPVITVKDTSGKTLTVGTDYSVSYILNVQSKTATAYIAGIGAYTGKASRTFALTGIDFTKLDAQLEYSSAPYTGFELKPYVTVTDLNGNTLTPFRDYTVIYSNNIRKGTATVTIKGNGLYIGTITKSFTIGSAEISSAQVTLSSDILAYTGNAQKPSVTVTFGGTKLTAGTDYTVTYSDNRNIGRGYVTVTGKGLFTGSTTASFTIAPKKQAITTLNALPEDKLISAAVTSDTNASGYEINYSSKQNFLGGLSFKVSGNTQTAVSIQKSLIVGRTYYVRARSYAIVNGAYVYGEWSDVLSVTLTPKKGQLISALSEEYKTIKAEWVADSEVSGYEIGYSTENDFSDEITKKTDDKAQTSLSFTDGLVIGETYKVRVRSYKEENGDTVYGEWSDTVEVTLYPQKNSITDIRTVGHCAIACSFTTDSDASGYEVGYSSREDFVGGLTASVEDNSINTIAFQAGLVVGRTYYIRVRSFKLIDGERIYGEWSNVSTHTLYSDAPTITGISAISGKELSASFDYAGVADGYQVNYSSKDTFVGGLSVKTTEKSASFTNGLVIGRTYYVRVRSYNVINGKTYYGKWSEVMTHTLLPKAPVIEEITIPGHRALACTFTTDNAVSGYEVGYSSREDFVGGLSASVEDNSISTVAFQSGLVVGRTYYIRVRAYKLIDGEALYGEWSEVSVKELVSESPAVTGINAISSKELSASFEYTGVADGYQVNYSSKPTFVGGLSVKTTENTASFSHGLVVGRTYYIRVRSYKEINGITYYGKWSEVVTHQLLPQKPVITAISTPSTRKIKVSWEKDSTVTGYQVNYSSKDTFVGGLTASTNSPSTNTVTFTNGLVTGRTYYIRVRGYKTTNGITVYGEWSDISIYKLQA